MEHMITNFCKAWIAALASLTYSYYISKIIKRGIIIRLISLFPIIALFTLLPLNLSPSPHLCGNIAFFLAWLANFKLLLFAFNKGPLSSSPISLIQFISIASLPIKTKQSKNNKAKIIFKSPLNYTIKFLLFAMLLRIYDYRSLLYHKLLLTIYCLHIYLGLELLLAMSASIAHFLLKIEVEMPFDEPYLSMSLQEFWGRRWNLVVSSVLRSSVYEPVRLVLMPVIGKRWGSACARVATFMVSGLMHELIYFYWTRVEPTWEVSMFFVLHGVCTALEVLVIKKIELGEKRRVMNNVVSWVLTMGFVVGTSLLLFFPQVVRNKVDLRVIEEHIIAFQFSANNLFGSRIFTPHLL